jgi:hypothetical protein
MEESDGMLELFTICYNILKDELKIPDSAQRNVYK